MQQPSPNTTSPPKRSVNNNNPAVRKQKQSRVPSPPKPDPIALMKQYFKIQMRELSSQNLKHTFITLQDSKKQIHTQIRFKGLQVNPEQTNLTQTYLKVTKITKREKLQKQVDSLNRNDFQSEQNYLSYKKKLLDQLHEQINKQKQQQSLKTKKIQQKVKFWSTQHKQLTKNRQKNKNKMQEQYKNLLNQEQRKKQQQLQTLRLQKKNQAVERIKQIQQNRLKRIQMNRKLKEEQDKKQKQPKYIGIQKSYRQIEEEVKFQANIAKKNNKLARKIDYQALKEHEKIFLKNLQERNLKIEESRSRVSSQQPQSDFNIFTNREQEKYTEQREKRRRIKKYQDKIKQIPVEIDQAKKVAVQIQLDKAKNRFKYHFLGQKSLNQFQIYGEFKNFAITTDAKQIGNNYLEEVKQHSKQSRARLGKSSSVQIIRQSQSQKPIYKDYLAQFKMKRTSLENNNVEEQVTNQRYRKNQDIQKIIKQHHQNKQATKRELVKTSQKMESQALKKKKQAMMDSVGYKMMLKKQQKMDQAYSTALKARLAYLQMKK